MAWLSRRSFLAASAGATAITLAGCTDSTETSTSSPSPTPTRSTPDSLAIENLHFCTEQPTGYREYQEQPDATYEPTETVWVYFEPSTVGTAPAGEGEVEVSFEIQWTVADPDGEHLDTVTHTVSRAVPESADLSTLFLWLDFASETTFAAGRHRMEITVTDTISDTTASETVAFQVEPPIDQAAGTFGVPDFAYLQDRPTDYGEYTPQPESTYQPDDTVWYYAEVDGVHYRKSGDTKHLDISVQETVVGPDGETWVDRPLRIDNEMPATSDLSTYYVASRFVPNDRWLVGSYDQTLTITDGLADDSIEIDRSFSVADP